MKMKSKRRCLASLMAFVMLAGALPVTAFAEEHTHTEECYAKAGALLCKISESEGHSHTSECVCPGGEYICGLGETEGHEHTQECICPGGGEDICGWEESEGHTHDEDCYAEGEELICGKEEIEPCSLDEASDGAYHVWFDGTIGVQELLKNSNDKNTYHPGMSSYYEGATDTYVEVTDGKVTLPKTAGMTSKYDYTLNGWYDVYSGNYYGKDMLGKEIDVTQDTVFYADWKASDYSLGNSEREKVTNQPNTSGFIETNVFDYNELFNIRSTTNDSVDSRTYVNADTHAELWRLNTSSLGFAFLNWAYNDLTKDRTLGSIADKDTKNSALSNITQNIISGSDGRVTAQGQAILDALFTESDDLGRYYLGEGDGLYQYVFNPEDVNCGYYYYDSSKNGASYNQSEERFVLYSQPEYILEQNLRNKQWQYKTGKATTTGFLPFNDNATGEYNEKDGSINYWFGMQSTVDFWLPNDPGTNGNISDTGKEMEFRFSGDDDVWVFVDDTLVLDLGGIHGARSGSINFSTGEVVTQTGKNQTTDEAITETTPLTESIKSGDHKLTIYYLERGSSQSNCSIYFNIAPKYALTILKKDADDDSALKDARFGIYSDEECTNPAELYADVDESGDFVNEFVTDAYGMATCYGMAAGNTYYIKEIEAPDGYHITDGEPIRITWDNDGNPEVDAGVIFEQNKADKRYYLTVTNEKNPGSLTISKTVAGTGIPAADTAFEFTVTKSGASAAGKYSVDGSEAQDIPENGKISIKAGQSALLTELKPGEYTVTETTPEQANYKSTTFSVNGEPAQSDCTATVTVSSATASSANVASVAFTNQYEKDDTPTPTPPTPDKGTGNLTVSKTVAGNAGSQTADFHFTVKLSDTSISGTYGEMTFANGIATFTLKHNEKKTATGLPAGISYEVTESEADQDGYTTTSTGANGSIVKDQTVTAAFTNTKKSGGDDSHDDLGNLIVSKVVAGNAGDTNKAFSFTVKLGNSTISGSYGEMTFANGIATFTLKHNEKKTATGLPAGISYEVTESEANQSGYTTTATGANGSIVKDQTATAAFTNTKNSSGGGGGGSKHSYGNLTVSKTVTGNAGETDRKFTFTVKLDRSLAGKYGDMTFNKGVAVITLKHGESSTATDLPAGVAYTVTESDNDGYTVTVVGDSGVISDGKTVVAAFTNNKDTTPDTPNAPDNPNVPNTPDTPNAPDNPDNPNVPNNPDTPNTPDKPAVPTDSVPQTGDESNVGFWLALMIISFAAFTGVCIYGRKRRYTGRHVQK